MNVVISPAKKLDFDSPVDFETSQPLLEKKTKQLLSGLKDCSQEDIKKMMKLSDSLAELNYLRFQNFAKTKDKKAAVFAFNGDTYRGLEANSLSKKDIEYAQKHLQILSGLYGVLRPLDQIKPYRLEMGTRFGVKDSKNLYQFWGSDIANTLNEFAKSSKSKYLVNCASEEYFKSVKREECQFNIIDVKFLDEKNGEFKIISFLAKKARGTMAKYIIQNKVKTIDELKAFAEDGYKFSASESSESLLVFKRRQ